MRIGRQVCMHVGKLRVLIVAQLISLIARLSAIGLHHLAVSGLSVCR